MTAGIPRWLSSCTSSSLPRRTLDLLRSHAIARDATRSGEPLCWNRLVVASAAEVTIRDAVIRPGRLLPRRFDHRPARKTPASSGFCLSASSSPRSSFSPIRADRDGTRPNFGRLQPQATEQALTRTPKPAHVLTLREGHTPDIESHLPAVTEPRPGERCVLCNEPAGKVVLGPIERVSGLRRRTPVCTKCANSRASRPRRWR